MSLEKKFNCILVLYLAGQRFESQIPPYCPESNMEVWAPAALSLHRFLSLLCRSTSNEDQVYAVFEKFFLKFKCLMNACAKALLLRFMILLGCHLPLINDTCYHMITAYCIYDLVKTMYSRCTLQNFSSKYLLSHVASPYAEAVVSVVFIWCDDVATVWQKVNSMHYKS